MPGMHQECETYLAKVEATVVGDLLTREYKFAVGGCFNFLALPQGEIDALGLRSARMTVKLASTEGLIDAETYVVYGKLLGQEFTAILVPGAAPMMGYHVL